MIWKNLNLSQSTREHLQVAAVLLLLVVIFFWRVTILGEAFVSTAMYFHWHPWKSVAPPDQRLENPWVSDRADGLYPAYSAVWRMLREGTLPLWDPYVTSGRPLAAVLHRGMLYPLEIILWLLPLNFAFGLHHIVEFFIAGFFMYLFLREVGVGKAGAAVGGIAFTYNSFHVVWWKAAYPSAVAPLMFWLAERLIRRKSLATTCLLALSIAAVIAGGFFTVSAYCLYAVGVYFLMRVAQELKSSRQWRPALRQVVLFGVAVGLGLLVLAPGIMAEFEFWSSNSYVSRRIDSGFGQINLPLTSVIRIFSPFYYGDPLGDTFYGNFPETAGYLGILPWLLAMIGLLFQEKKGITLYFAGLAIISYGMIFGAPFNTIIGRLPVMNAGSPTRMFSSGAFAIAGLAALGFDFLHRRGPTLSTARRRWLVLTLLLTVAAITAILVLTDMEVAQEGHRWRFNTLTHVLDQGEMTHFQVINLLKLSLWILLGVNVILAWTKGWLARRVFVIEVVVLLTLDIFSFGISYNPTLPYEHVMPTTPGIAFLQEKQETGPPFRILGLDATLWPNSSAVYGLYDIRAHGSSTDRYDRYIARIDPSSQRGQGHGTVRLFSRNVAELDSPLLDLLNVRYVLVEPGVEQDQLNEADDLRLVYDGEDMWIYENPSHFPHAYAVCQYEVVTEGNAIREGLADGTLDPHTTAWLEAPIGKPLPGGGTGCVSSPPQITHYAANRITVEVVMDEPGLLIMSDVDYPGWRATLDGERIPIHKANYIFRAVYLPAGAHEVRFHYLPTGVAVGAIVSLVTLSGMAVVLGRTGVQKLAQRRDSKGATS